MNWEPDESKAITAMPIFASYEGLLIFVIFVIISAVSNWLKKKGETTEDSDTWSEEPAAPSTFPPRAPPQRSPAPAPAPPPVIPTSPEPVNWEEEVRRLLGESEVPAPKPPPMPTPPLLVPQVPAPLPMAPVRPLPRLASEAETVHAPKAIQKAFITQDKASRLDQEVEARMRTVTGKMGTMAESTTAHERARQLEGEVTSRLQKVAEEPVAPTYAVHRTRLSPEAKQVLQMLRTPRSARQAIVASIILQSPKGLE